VELWITMLKALFRKTISISQNKHRFSVLQTQLPHKQMSTEARLGLE